MGSRNSHMKQTPNEKEFFQSLYDLCRKHKVNMVSQQVEIKKPKGDAYTVYDWVEITGAWNIRPENEAVVMNRLDEPATGSTFVIKGQE